MYDRELVIEILEQLRIATEKILRRFSLIESPADFTGSDVGMEKLDAVCMQLIAIGESLKQLDKLTGNSLLSRYPEIEWKKAKGLRDIITHHYFDVNAEAIYNVCKNNIPALSETLERILKEI